MTPEEQKARNDANNAKNIRNAADVAIASKNPYAMAAGAAVKGADKLTGGKASEGLGKVMTKSNQMMPGGNRFQNMSNRLSESGVSDKIGKAASMKNQMAGSGTGNASKANEATKPVDNNNNVNKNMQNNTANGGGGQNGSLPSSSGGSQNESSRSSGSSL